MIPRHLIIGVAVMLVHLHDDISDTVEMGRLAAADGIEAFVAGRSVLSEQSLGGVCSATLYGHLDDSRWPPVRVGQFVAAGQVIGYVGSTGNARADAPHLRDEDPLELHRPASRARRTSISRASWSSST